MNSRPTAFADSEQRTAAGEDSVAHGASPASPRPAGLGPADTALLLELVGRLNGTESQDDVCQAVVEALAEAFPGEEIAVLLADATGKLRGRSWHRLSAAGQRALDECEPGLVTRHPKAPVLVDNVLGDDRFPVHGDALVAAGISHLAFASLLDRGRRIGALVLAGPEPRALGEREADLLSAVAEHVGHAVVRVQLAESQRLARILAEQNVERMQRLVRVAAQLSSALTAHDVAAVIVKEGTEAIGAANGGVWSIDAEAGLIRMMRAQGYPPELEKRFATLSLQDDNPLSLAIRSDEPAFLSSWEEYAHRFVSSESSMRGVPRPPQFSFVCLPLRIEGQTIGGLTFTFFENRKFTDDEKTFVGLLAQHCAQGIDRARLYERALDSIRVRDDFLSVAGHELRTPLTTLLLQTQHLLGLPENAAASMVRERGNRLLKTVVRLTKLAEELLDVSRIRAGRLRLEPERVDLAELVRDVVGRTVDVAREASIEIHVEGEVEGNWDRMRVEQVVTNLMTNALKYGGGKPIDVRVGPHRLGACIVVRDRGCGISEVDQQRIFERFERASAAPDSIGLGLGLWIVREIVQAHGGSIAVASLPGEGAEFSVTLPLETPPDRSAG